MKFIFWLLGEGYWVKDGGLVLRVDMCGLGLGCGCAGRN